MQWLAFLPALQAFNAVEDAITLAEASLHLEEVEPANASRQGVHTCGCVTAADVARRDLKRLRWVHFPKTGTSFWATIFSYACRKKGNVDMHVSSFWRHPGCGSCYDFAIKERYPTTEYCAADAFGSLETQHQPLPPSDPAHTVAFFRDPSERLLSAAVNRHMSGFKAQAFHRIQQQCYKTGLDPACVANFAGVKGCMARMLTGGYCADDGAAHGAPFNVDVNEAIRVLRTLAFVGLTEEWNDSVCLFHKMFGGRVTQAEFHNFHPSHHPKPDMHIRDELDDPLYEAAKARFHELQKQYGAQQCYKFVPNPAGCVPKTCEEAGAECGPIMDGCGAALQCGQCPQHRAGPATCSANKCMTASPAPPGTFDVASFKSPAYVGLHVNASNHLAESGDEDAVEEPSPEPALDAADDGVAHAGPPAAPVAADAASADADVALLHRARNAAWRRAGLRLI
jgi:hypothetical protein